MTDVPEKGYEKHGAEAGAVLGLPAMMMRREPGKDGASPGLEVIVRCARRCAPAGYGVCVANGSDSVPVMTV